MRPIRNFFYKWLCVITTIKWILFPPKWIVGYKLGAFDSYLTWSYVWQLTTTKIGEFDGYPDE